MSDGELVPDDVTPRELREEAHLRSCRAGYTTRDGGPIPRRTLRRVNWGRTKLNVWPRDANGELIE